MKTIVLDGNLIKKDGHKYLKKALDFPDYYGNNLDALYDCLTDICVPTVIKLTNKNKVSHEIIETFIDASHSNPSLEFRY